MDKLFILLVTMIAFQANAAGKWCNGTIDNSYIEHSGNVFIIGSWRGEHTKVCNLNSTWKGITASTCKTWVGYIQLALVSRAPVTMHYSDISSCSSIGPYGSAEKPSYIMISKN